MDFFPSFPFFFSNVSIGYFLTFSFGNIQGYKERIHEKERRSEDISNESLSINYEML